jgi:hypothetical protein
MMESIPLAIEFSHFTMSMELINSRTENRMSRKLFARLKHNPVYSFLIKNLIFKTTLDVFHLRPYILNNKVRSELQNEELYEEYVAMSLMGNNVMDGSLTIFVIRKYECHLNMFLAKIFHLQQLKLHDHPLHQADLYSKFF